MFILAITTASTSAKFQKSPDATPLVAQDRLDSFRSDVVQQHNEYRKKHCLSAKPIVLSKQLTDVAQHWAVTMAMYNSADKHSQRDDLGLLVFNGKTACPPKGI